MLFANQSTVARRSIACIHGRKQSSTVDFANGFAAGVGAKLLTLPFDVTKKRLQVKTFGWEDTGVRWRSCVLASLSRERGV